MLGNSITSLDPDDLDTASQSGIEDYTCCICQLIPDPQTAIEEENCGHIFCESCINQWQKKMTLVHFVKIRYQNV